MTAAVTAGLPRAVPAAAGSAGPAPVAVRDVGPAVRAPAARRRPAPLLVAYASAYLSPGMLRVAELLARRDGVNAHVAAVLPRVHDHSSVLGPEDREALRAGRLLLWRRHVRRQLHRTVGRAARFSTSVHEGATEHTLAALTRARGAGYVLVSLDDPGAPGRMESERAMLQLARLSAAPVLGLPRGATAVPTRALVAVDGSAGSERAARAVAGLVPPGSRLTLVHVVHAMDDRAGSCEPVRTLRGRCSARGLEPLAAELRSAADVAVETVWLEGDPVEAVLAFAGRRDVDLLACGTSVSAPTPWHPMAGTAAGLLRGARGAVLVAPPPDAAA